MPIKWTLLWQPNAGTKLDSNMLDEFSKCAESMNGIKKGPWNITFNLLEPVVRSNSIRRRFRFHPSLMNEFPSDFMGVSLPEEPGKHYLVLVLKKVIVEADVSIQVIMEKLQSYRSSIAYVIEGVHYHLGSFQFRLGKIFKGVPQPQTFVGILLEVEFIPIFSLAKSVNIIEDILKSWNKSIAARSLPGLFKRVVPKFADFGLGDHYTSQHTAVQYCFVMAAAINTYLDIQAAELSALL